MPDGKVKGKLCIHLIGPQFFGVGDSVRPH